MSVGTEQARGSTYLVKWHKWRSRLLLLLHMHLQYRHPGKSTGK